MILHLSTNHLGSAIAAASQVENVLFWLAYLSSAVESWLLLVESQGLTVEYCGRLELNEPAEVEY